MPQSTPPIAQSAPRVPRNAGELEAIRARRSELRAQLASATDWRGRLVQERHNAQATGNMTVVQELDGRIREFGDRSARLERALLQTDDAIGQAVANGVESGPHVVDLPAAPGPLLPGAPG